MGFLHSSRAKGRVSTFLKTAADIRFVGIDGERNDTTWLHFEVAPFEAVSRELFQQQKLWDDAPKPDETAFELLGAALEDIAVHRTESDRFDSGLLNRIRSYRRVLKRGVTSITLPDAHLPTQARVDKAVVRAASDLVAITPGARRVRVVGRLDVMGASQSVLKLQVQPGQIVMARWEGSEPIDSLREHFNREIVVEGIGIFRPSGEGSSFSRSAGLSCIRTRAPRDCRSSRITTTFGSPRPVTSVVCSFYRPIRRRSYRYEARLGSTCKCSIHEPRSLYPELTAFQSTIPRLKKNRPQTCRGTLEK